MRRSVRHAASASAIAAALALVRSLGAQAPPPDLIVYDAKIVTVDQAFSTAQAMAIRGGRFVAVGSDASALATAGPSTTKIDLRGADVLPGFNDTHNHQNSGISLVTSVDLTNIHSIADIQNAIAARVKAAAKREWISGTRGWWEYELSDKRLPTRYDLDKVAPDNPVVIPGPHYMIANSLALKLAEITRDTPDPQGGEIWKNPQTGEPTGLLMDNASAPIRRFLPRPTRDQALDGLRKIMAVQNGFGLTSIRQPGGSKEDVALYRELYARGELHTRVDFAYEVNAAAPEAEYIRQLDAIGAPGQQFGDGMFRADGLAETGLDGAEITALLRDDLPTKPGYRGLQKIPTEHFKLFAAEANRRGWRLGPHAVGDAAIDEALDAFEYANQQKSIVGRRWMIDHAFLLRPDHYERVKKLGLIINSQYMHNYQLGELILRAWKRPLADMSERYADFVVLSRDILTIPAEAIKDTHVVATVLGGKTVFGTLAAPPPSQGRQR